MSLPPELTISVELVAENQYLAKVLRPNGEEICRNVFTFSPGLLVDIEPQWMLEKAVPRNAAEWAKRGPADAARDPEQDQKLADYGQRMYQFLFGDAVDWEAFLKYNDDYRRETRVTLALHANAAALWQLPWEYLHDGQDFLALNGRFWLTRSPYGLARLTPEPAALPIRLLVIVSAPDDQAALDTEEEIAAIQQALDEATRAGRIQVQYLDDATLPNIGAKLKEFNPHILHYTGHGAYDPASARSFLALEDDDGLTVRAGIDELRPHLNDAPDLRLVVLSGCQTAQTSAQDAFSGVATGLLERDIPAVLAMQFSILDQSGIELARAFYHALAQGEPPEQAAQRARLALWQFKEGPGFDWGIPALYLRAGGQRLISADAPVPAAQEQVTLLDLGGLPLPPHFVGRKKELRALRKALRDPDVTAAFVRGIGGMGKSSLAAKLLERPGCDLDAAALVIRCHELDPYDIPAKIANFLSAQGKANHAEAAALLLDSAQPPAERARRALEMVRDQRYLLVFDNFESLLPSPAGGGAGGEGLVPFFRGLLSARWRGLLLFTSRQPWPALDEHIGRGTALELELPDLTARQAIMLMDNLPRLRLEPISTKIAVFNKVGGHPKSLELLEGWLSSGRLVDLLDNAALDGLLRPQWEDYFLKALLAQLPQAERETLERLSIFETALDEEEFTYAGVKPEALQHWQALSLVQRQQAAPDVPAYLLPQLPSLPEAERRKLQPPATYALHPLVRDYLLGGLPAGERARLHAWAAAFYGKPFIEMARRYVQQTGQTATDEQIEYFTRDLNGVVGQIVRRTDDMPIAHSAMARALQWQAQLFKAGQSEAAGEIVTAVWHVLDSWGEHDRAKALLQASIRTRKGGDKAVAQGNLATLLQSEGQLVEALTIHEELYQTFAALDARPQMGTALGQQGSVLMNMGRFDEAIEKQTASLEIHRQYGDEKNQAINLHQLSILHRLQDDYSRALDRSQAAEVLNQKIKREIGVASNLHEQGLIFIQMARTTDEENTAHKYIRTAAERFAQSLNIWRRVGDQSGAANTLIALGVLWREFSEQIGDAISAFNEALDIHQRLGNPAKVGITLEHLGLVHERQGQYAAALEKFRQALRLTQQYGSRQDVAIMEQDIARVQAKLQG